jgi:hypothetical protein
MSLRANAGTITFRVSHPNTNWPADSLDYRFGPTEDSPDGVAVAAFKYGDGTFEVRAADATEHVAFRGSLPPGCPPEIRLAVTWDSGTITLYIEGAPVDQTVLPPLAELP